MTDAPGNDLNEAPPGPLDGIRVLDLTRMVAGNQLTMLLGDFGADVVKVEQPGVGDTLRHWLVGGRQAFFSVYGRNKRSVTVDLKATGARDVVLAMAARADVVVESFRPGALERMDLAPEVLQAANPALVVVRISGWGQTGSMNAEPGFGTLIEARSGFAAMNGYPDRPPVVPPGALADMVAGTYGAFAVTAALRHADRTGTGQIVDLSLFEPLFSILGPQAAMYDIRGVPPARTGSRSSTSAPRNVFRAGDGEYVALSASTQKMTERLFTAMGRPELIDDPRFTDNATRLVHVEELDAILGDYFASMPRAQLLQRMSDAGVTVGAVSHIGQLMESEFFATRGVVVDGPAPDAAEAGEWPGGTVPMHAPVPRLSVSPGAIRRPAPGLGEHTDEVLSELGDVIDDDRRRELAKAGVFG